MKNYDHKKIEKKWQKYWGDKSIYKTLDAKKAKNKKLKPCYVLDMFPYPSGSGLHVGHPRGYIGSDVFARMKRMQGYNVLHPMGYDAFGLPAEQYAITHNVHPRKAVELNVKTFEHQLSIIGLSYDWSRKINTTDEEYYKWTQWIFLQLYNSYYDNVKNKAQSIDSLIKKFSIKGSEDFTAKEWKNFSSLEKQNILMKYRLAYEGYAEVNWCPELGTVLANDEIVDDKDGKPVSERGGYPVEKKSMRQWFMRITAYAERLLSGLDDLDWPEHIKEIQKNWIGKEIKDNQITYNIRDAIFARQRYWGEPIPLFTDKDGIIHEVKKLPLKLPNVKSYSPTGTGEGPLGSVKEWKLARYETNTMPGWAGSSWYFLRYIDPKNKKSFASDSELDYWFSKNKGGVDMYVGGAEHATGHLLYSRFWHNFLHDMNYVPCSEPFKTLRNQGMIGGSDGRKMSKRWGNVVNPDDVINTYGADSLRVFEMFLGPFDSHLPWSTDGIIGSRRFVEKVWRIKDKVVSNNIKVTDSNIEKILHKTIKKVSEDIETMSFNTAVSSMMICANEIESNDNKISIKDFKLFLQILAPFASHITEEIWFEFEEKKSIHLSKWPKYDEKKIVEDNLKIGISVNGKIRGEMFITNNLSEEEVKSMALVDISVLPWIEGKEVKKVIYVKNRLINIVI